MEKKTHRGRMWNVMGNFCAECGSIFFLKGQKQERFWRKLLGKDKKGYKVSGSKNPLFREVLEQVKRSADGDCGEPK